MIKILFVCHGNICRSPMAEFVMKELVRLRGLEREFQIDSAATSREELGNGIYPPARAKLREMGIPFDSHCSVQVTREDYDRYDYLIIMDRNNRRNLMRILGSDPENKVHTLLSYAGIDRDVADPWYTGDFDATYEDVMTGCTALLEQLV
ncbi:MAG: low molecular weight protein-tyrosine-phosphatase [Butyricicoccus sp.]